MMELPRLTTDRRPPPLIALAMPRGAVDTNADAGTWWVPRENRGTARPMPGLSVEYNSSMWLGSSYPDRSE